MRYALPLVLFAAVLVFLGVGLQRDPSLVPSPLIGKPFPQFKLTTLHDQAVELDADLTRGGVTILNVWASWCAACRDEHPLLMSLDKSAGFRLVGMNYKDQRDDGIAWLERHGNPYQVSLFDQHGKLGLDLGVYGVPETFVIDATGTIRAKHVGPLDQVALNEKILAVVQSLNTE